jgi:hypothetical protein
MGSSALIITALSAAYSAAARYQEDAPLRRAERREIADFENRLTLLLEDAFLSDDVEDDNSYFIGLSTAGVSETSDTLVFTTLSKPIQGGYMQDYGAEFEDLNDEYGPQGGLCEVQISTMPTGDPGIIEGAYVREQVPADGDPTQGGWEQSFDATIDELTFEFFDGLEWQADWSTDEGVRRLPAAIRVEYRRYDEEVYHVMHVRLRNSDVTQEDPAVIEQDTGDDQ